MTRSIWPALAGGILVWAAQASAQTAKQPPAPTPHPVSDTYYGTTVVDPYRFMEKLDDPAVNGWMRAEGDYTRSLFASIPGRAAMAERIARFTGSFDFTKLIEGGGGRIFYEERAPGSDNYDLLTRDPNGATRKLVDVAALRAANGGKPYAINYYLASPAGDKVAVGISSGGSENASITVYDVASGRAIAGPLPLARFGASGWSDDGRLLYVNLLAQLPKGAPDTDTYRNSRAFAWDLRNPPVALFGGDTPSAISVAPERFPSVRTRAGGTVALGIVRNGVENEIEMWTAPVARAARPDAPWVKRVATADGIVSADFAGDRLVLLSHDHAPTFKVLSLKAGEPLATAKTIVAARPGRTIDDIAAAVDGVYVLARVGVYSQMFRVPYDGGPERPVPLPVKGSFSDVYSDPTRPGVIFTVESWAVPPVTYAYDPAARTLTDLKLGTTPAGYDGARYRVEDLSARAKDGTMVPLSYVGRAGAHGPQIVLLSAYGSYGVSEFPAFSPRAAFALDEGIDYATCHVRGGGELGEAWRLGGKDANKPNTWRDLIACGEDLVRRGYTTPAKLFIVGGSAGGITIGRAIEEAPSLFAGAIDAVPSANPVRAETYANGVPNIPEFGTVTTERGFRNLYSMDSYLHLVDGTKYPSILITTGLNDPRVTPWQPAKFAARLMASGTPNPVLLRIDAEAGHGIGSTKHQQDELSADMTTFIKWNAGVLGWQPAR